MPLLLFGNNAAENARRAENGAPVLRGIGEKLAKGSWGEFPFLDGLTVEGAHLLGTVGLFFEPHERVVFRAVCCGLGFGSGEDAELHKITFVDLQ